MSTPTKDDKNLKEEFHRCDGKLYSRAEFCPRHGKNGWLNGIRNYWIPFRIEIPKRPQERFDFFAIIIGYLIAELILGPIIGILLRSIFG